MSVERALRAIRGHVRTQRLFNREREAYRRYEALGSRRGYADANVEVLRQTWLRLAESLSRAMEAAP